MNWHGAQTYSFGPFSLVVSKRSLQFHGQPVHLKPKVLDVLLALVQSNGNMLTKDELMQQLWPESFVEENNLAVCVSLLRKALKQGGEAEAYIETIPRRGYRFAGEIKSVMPAMDEAEPAKSATQSAKDLRQKLKGKLIAVLPLEVVGAPEHIRGLNFADALITTLAHADDFKVRPTSIVRHYVTGKFAPSEIGTKLEVDFVLEGIVRAVEHQLRVTVQLSDVESGVVIWADKFDAAPHSFLVEDSVARRVSLAFGLPDRRKTFAPAIVSRSRQAESKEAYIKGRYFWGKKTTAGLQRSVEYFERSIALDPGYALPYAGLADAYVTLANINVLPMADAYSRAREYALHALMLDAGLPEAHSALAIIQMISDRDWVAAEEAFRRVIELTPESPLAYQRLAVCLRHLGRFDEALTCVDKAHDLDPTSACVSTSRALVFHYAERYDEANEEIQRGLELDSTYPIGHFAAGMIYTQQGRYQEALDEFETTHRLAPSDTPEIVMSLAHVYGLDGRRTEAQQLVTEFSARTQRTDDLSYHVAAVYAGLGDRDTAFSFLERGYQNREFALCTLKVDPRFHCLRSDARLLPLLESLGLNRPLQLARSAMN